MPALNEWGVSVQNIGNLTNVVAHSPHVCVFVSPFVLLGGVALLLVWGRPNLLLYDARCPCGMIRKQRLISDWGDLILPTH